MAEAAIDHLSLNSEDEGHVRQLDDLGRITIPKDIRRTLGWGEGTVCEIEMFELECKAKSVIIRQAQPNCAICRMPKENMQTVKDTRICPDCLAEIKEG